MDLIHDIIDELSRWAIESSNRALGLGCAAIALLASVVIGAAFVAGRLWIGWMGE